MPYVIRNLETNRSVSLPGTGTMQNVCGWMEAHTAGNRRDCAYYLRSGTSYTASGPSGFFCAFFQKPLKEVQQ